MGQRKTVVNPQVRDLGPGIRWVAEKENDSRNGKSELSSVTRQTADDGRKEGRKVV